MNVRFLFVCALLLGVLGCRKSGPSGSLVENAPTEHASSTGNEVTASGVSLTFPKDWKVVNMSKGQFDAAMAPLVNQPHGAEMAQLAKTVAHNGMVKLIVFAPEGSKPGFMNNANLVVQPGVGKATMDQVLDMTKRQIATLDPGVVASKATFPAGEFGCVKSHLKAPNGSPYSSLAYMKIDGNDLEVVTFSCADDAATAFEGKAQEVMKSFKRT